MHVVCLILFLLSVHWQPLQAHLARSFSPLNWRGDGKLSSHTIGLPDYADERSYVYAAGSRRLAEERLSLDSERRRTNAFVFDGGSAGGLGVLTSSGEALTNGFQWKGGADAFARISAETNSAVRRMAQGRTLGPATVEAFLDGGPVPVSTVAGTNYWGGRTWYAALDVPPGTHQLRASALHPSRQYRVWATSYFTNALSERSESLYSIDGQLLQRVWKSGSQTNRVQTFAWDARGRLLGVAERDNGQNGFNWSAVYDGFGRRVRTTSVVVSNNTAFAEQATIISQYYDPEAEFLELGVSVNGLATWKVYGPDLNGVYGGLNGVGGFEAIVPGADLFCPLLSDAQGNIHAVYDQLHRWPMWFSNRVSAFGGVAGQRPLPLGFGAMGVQDASA